MDAAASAMAASYGAVQHASQSHCKSQGQAHSSSSSLQPRRQGLAGSRCGAQTTDADFLFDAALAATAAAAAVLPMYWLYVHSASSSSKSTKPAAILEAPSEITAAGLENLPISEESAFVCEEKVPKRFAGEGETLNLSAEHRVIHSDVDLRHGLDPPLKQEVSLAQAIEKMIVKTPSRIESLKLTRTEEQEELLSYDKLIRAGRVEESLEVLEELENKGMLDMNKIYHVRFYQECRKQMAVEQAFRYTRLIKSPTLSTFNLLISVCANAADTDGAFGAFTALKNAGFQPDCMIYTTLLSTCAKALKIDLLFQVFHEMQNRGIEANAHTYGAIIDGCARAGEMAKAFGVYKSMIAKKIKPDRVIFNSLVNACGRSGAGKRAFDVFTELKADAVPLEPNHITMCSLIDACSRAGDVESAYEVYKMMRKRRVKATPEPYTAAVHACSHSGDLERALSIYQDMKKDRIQPDEVFFSALIDVAGHAGRVDSAFEILQEVEKSSLAAGPIIFSSLMGVCSNTGNWEKAMVLFKDIQALGIRPTVSTLNALVTALCRGKQFQNAIRSLQEVKEAGVAPNQLTYNILLEACEKENEAEVALSLYVNAVSEGIVPDLSICSSMIGICLEGIRSFTYPPRLASSIDPSWIAGDKEKLHHQWLSWALAVYRQTILTGVTPTIPLLSRMLGCLRIPETHRSELGLAFQADTSASNKNLVEGFGVYDPRASALYGEAAALGVVPSFQCDSRPIVFEADSLPLYAAEVCVITILKALKHRCAVDAPLPLLTVKFESHRRTVTLPDGRIRSITMASRNGQAIAALLRKLRLRFNGKESSGRLRLSPAAISQWFKPSTATATFAVASSPNRAESTVLGRSIAEQQRAIRMGTPLPNFDTKRSPGGFNLSHRFKKSSQEHH